MMHCPPLGLGMDWEKIKRVRGLIERGDYTHPDFLNAAIEVDFDRLHCRLSEDIEAEENIGEEEAHRRVAEAFAGALEDIRNCPEGEGTSFRDAVARLFSLSFENLVDVPLMRKECPCKGGRIDFELPVRTEIIDRFSLWKEWCEQYKISSMLVEVKNTAKRAAPEDVAQILLYIAVANAGRFGILVSRHGFTKNAIKLLSAIRSNHEFLVLPFDQSDLEYLASLSNSQPTKSMELFRRKVTLLTQRG